MRTGSHISLPLPCEPEATRDPKLVSSTAALSLINRVLSSGTHPSRDQSAGLLSLRMRITVFWVQRELLLLGLQAMLPTVCHLFQANFVITSLYLLC